MQTFLPYKSFTQSLLCLDYKRLGKQRVEAMQIYNALLPGSNSRWKNHPAVKMWKGYESALAVYHNLAIAIWVLKGYNNSMKYLPINKLVIYPSWLNDGFCLAHRSNLMRKNYQYYNQFKWDIPNDLPYIWPVK